MKLDNISASIPDDRDWPYAPIKDAFFPPTKDLKPEVFEIEDQLAVGSCTTNSSVSACEMLAKESLSRLFPYWTTRNLIENAPGSEGASLRDAIRSLAHFGTPLEILWPYDVSKVNVEPEQEVFNSAAARTITRYEKIDIPALKLQGYAEFQNTFKSALSEGLGIVIATAIGKEIGSLTGPWQTHRMHPTALGICIGNGNTYVGNHATLIIGYDDSTNASFPSGSGVPGPKGSWLVQNSWGKNYGDGGFFGYSYGAMYLDVFEAWIVRGFKDKFVQPPVPGIQYITPPTDVIKWFHSVWRYDVTEYDTMTEAVQYWAMHPGGYRAFLECEKINHNDLVDKLLASLP